MSRSPFDRPQRSGRARRSSLSAGVVAAVFVGGCVGGAVRYAATRIGPVAGDRFPWPTFGVNVAGAFVLTVVIGVAVAVPSRYLRPLLGTGFCGGLTTFSSVVVATDQFLARSRTTLAAAYLGTTVLGALVAGAAGLMVGRVAAGTRPAHHRGGKEQR